MKGSNPQHKGTGLGLPITKGFAELLGGSISARSMEGKGSTFTVRVPVEYQKEVRLVKAKNALILQLRHSKVGEPFAAKLGGR